MAETAWTEAVKHRSVDALSVGTIDDATFRRYLIQDHAFIGSLVGLVGSAVATAQTMAAKAELSRFLGGTHRRGEGLLRRGTRRP